jgi:hypothetical protein
VSGVPSGLYPVAHDGHSLRVALWPAIFGVAGTLCVYALAAGHHASVEERERAAVRASLEPIRGDSRGAAARVRRGPVDPPCSRPGHALEFATMKRRMLGRGKLKGCKPSQLALAWVLAQGEDIVPIPGTKRRKYLEENAAAAAITLSADELARIDEAAPKGAASDLRYPAAFMGSVAP